LSDSTGKWLSQHKGRIGADLVLKSKSDNHGHAARWWVEKKRDERD
jgi:hypothetical protein